jgi:CheY-like chemotaxis protein
VVLASSGIDAVQLVLSDHPDIILMDIQMPGMDGLEAIRRLRAMPDYAATPIIALTAIAMRGDRERCLAAGATAYMTKPVSLKGLVGLIAQLIHA